MGVPKFEALVPIDTDIDTDLNELYCSVCCSQNAGLRQHGTCIHYAIQYSVIKTLRKMLDKMQLYLKRQIKCY